MNNPSFNQDVKDEEFVDGSFWSASQTGVGFSEKNSFSISRSYISFSSFGHRTSMSSFPGIHLLSQDDMRHASLHLRTTSRRASQHSLQNTSSRALFSTSNKPSFTKDIEDEEFVVGSF